MKKIIQHLKDYWITYLILLAMVLGYIVISDHGWISALMFPKVGLIAKAFYDNRGMQLQNVASSFLLLVPSVLITLILALGIGLLMGLHEKARKVIRLSTVSVACLPSFSPPSSFSYLRQCGGRVSSSSFTAASGQRSLRQSPGFRPLTNAIWTMRTRSN